ncbi:uncharacterized protein LOC114535079 [Dendronephthya gigantea]|uniref:uncharacterized protein LOC114535079 n=1 Tax=Dendronephthya gigantea TaxID=151771 RepID=UPI00106CEFC7|nr:uncharacterized protein LOC114535079 [Dendronephthya gigantea]
MCIIRMDASISSIDSLTWSDKPCPLSEVLERNMVPNLVRVEEGYCGINEACSFENDQVLMLHRLRTRQNFIAEDSVGRSIAIPVDCKTELLVCPLSIYCTYDPILVAEISNVYSDVKYFRVIENEQEKGIEKYFELGSVFEVDYVDTVNFHVKFKDVKMPLPFSCGIVFEALLDYREYTLKEAVKEFGLPIKVRFLSSGDEKEQCLDSDVENLASNLGKVTISHSSKPQLTVVATEIDDDQSLTLTKKSTKCLVISKELKLNVFVSKEYFENHRAFVQMVSNFNKAFLVRYDLKKLDRFERCEYLDGPDGHVTPKITGSKLVPKFPEENDNIREIKPSPRNGTGYKPPLLTPRPTRGGKGETISRRRNRFPKIAEDVGRYKPRSLADDNAQISKHCETTGETFESHPHEIYDDFKSTDRKVEAFGEYDDRIPKPKAKHDYELPMDDHVYESISDEDSSLDDEGYEVVPDEGYPVVPDDSPATSNDYVNIPTEGHVTLENTSTEIKSDNVPVLNTRTDVCKGSHLHATKDSGGRISTEPGDETSRMNDGVRDQSRSLILPAHLLAVKLKPVVKCAEISDGKPDRRNLRKASGLEASLSKPSREVNKHQRKMPINIPVLRPAIVPGLKGSEMRNPAKISSHETPNSRIGNENCVKTPISNKKTFDQTSKAGDKKLVSNAMTAKQNHDRSSNENTSHGSSERNYENFPLEKARSRQKPDFKSRSNVEALAKERGSNETSVPTVVNKSKIRAVTLRDQTFAKPGSNFNNITDEATRAKFESKTSRGVKPDEVVMLKSGCFTISSATISNVRPAASRLKSQPSISIPADLSCLSVAGVGRLLRSLNMQCYVNTFQEEQIDGKIFVTLDKESLSSLDIAQFHVTKLIKVIEGWRPNVGSI